MRFVNWCILVEMGLYIDMGIFYSSSLHKKNKRLALEENKVAVNEEVKKLQVQVDEAVPQTEKKQEQPIVEGHQQIMRVALPLGMTPINSRPVKNLGTDLCRSNSKSTRLNTS